MPAAGPARPEDADGQAVEWDTIGAYGWFPVCADWKTGTRFRGGGFDDSSASQKEFRFNSEATSSTS